MKTMRLETIFLLTVLGLCFPSIVSATWPRGYYLRGALGTANPDLDGINDRIAARSDLLQPFSGKALTVSGEIGMFVLEPVSLGIRIAYQDNDQEDFHCTGAFFGLVCVQGITHEVDTDIFEVLASVSVWGPRKTGLLLGANVGISRISVEECHSGAGRADYTWQEVGGVVELFTGFQYTWASEFMMFVEIGYSLRDLGIVDEKFDTGETLDMDFSAWFIELGIGGHTKRVESRALVATRVLR